MDNLRILELKRTGTMTGRHHPPPRKRQQRSLSSAHLSGKLMVVDKWRKEKARESKGGSLSNMDCDHTRGAGSDCNAELRPPLSPVVVAGACGRKRVKLTGKVSDDYPVVGSAVIPRKLRSAINKRYGDSPSPTALDEKMKYNNDPSGTESDGFWTKEEEEVAETLATWAFTIEDSESSKEANGVVVFCINSKGKQTSGQTVAEAAEGIDTTFQPLAAHNSSLDLEQLPKELKGKCMLSSDALDQNAPVSLPVSYKLELELNSTTGCNQTTALFVVSGDHMNPSNVSIGTPFLNGTEQSMQADNPLSPKTEVESYSLEDIASIMTHDVKTVDDEKKSLLFSDQQAATLEIQNAIAETNDNKLLTGIFSSKPADFQRVASAGCSTSKKPTEKPVHTTGQQTWKTWKNCATHVKISYLIKELQTKIVDASLNDHPKLKEAQTGPSKNRNGLEQPAVWIQSSASMRNKLDGKCNVLQESTLQPVHQANITSVPHSQKIQMHDFLSLLTGSKVNNSGIKMEVSGNLQITHVNALPPHNIAVPMSVSHGHYSSYPDYLAAASPQQVNFQRPQYLAHPFYTSHSGNMMKYYFHQQQQMWQTQLMQLKASPPLSGKWPGNKQSEANSLLIPPSSLLQPVSASSQLMEARGMAGCRTIVPMQRPRMPIPLPASNQSKCASPPLPILFSSRQPCP